MILRYGKWDHGKGYLIELLEFGTSLFAQCPYRYLFLYNKEGSVLHVIFDMWFPFVIPGSSIEGCDSICQSMFMESRWIYTRYAFTSEHWWIFLALVFISSSAHCDL